MIKQIIEKIEQKKLEKDISWGWADSLNWVKSDLEKAMQEQEEMSCEWKLIDDDNNDYETSCDFAFSLNNGNLKDNEIFYCPKCGKKIKNTKD